MDDVVSSETKENGVESGEIRPSCESPDSFSESGSSQEMTNLQNGVLTPDESMYSGLTTELISLREANTNLQIEVDRLERENSRLEADVSADLHAIHIETLEKALQQQKLEINRLQDNQRQHTEILQKQNLQMKQEYESKLDKLTKQYESASKERESMVMRYAVSEKSVIDLKKELQQQDSKTKDAMKEKEAMHGKVKAVIAEKARIHKLFDTKHNEVLSLEKEVEKKIDELHKKDSKLRWTEGRLKTESENVKEVQTKLEKLEMKLREAREETEQVRRDSQAMLRTYQEAEEAQTDREQAEKARMILDKYGEENQQLLQSELDLSKKRQQALIDENNHLCVKVQNLEKERLEYDSNLARMKQGVDQDKETIVDLQGSLAELESTKLLLQHEQDRCTASQAEVERLRTSNTDMQQEMEACRNREAELLEFTQKLTEKNVRLQSEFTALEVRIQQLDLEHGSLKRQLTNLTELNASLTEELERGKTQWREEGELLARHLAERTQRADELTQQLEDLRGEVQLLKKKHTVTLKELTKEVQTGRRRLEAFETNLTVSSMANGSRASSNTSLNTAIETASETSQQPSPVGGVNELDKQMLINKIVKTQRKNAKLTEKVEFLEEHTGQLVGELQKKTKIIQHYVVREQTGALTSSSMDDNKAALARHGGIMASLYNTKSVDEAMTLELSLEINQKMQALLEDTLLKNITLKENMETLGSEIARLTSVSRP